MKNVIYTGTLSKRERHLEKVGVVQRETHVKNIGSPLGGDG